MLLHAHRPRLNRHRDRAGRHRRGCEGRVLDLLSVETPLTPARETLRESTRHVAGDPDLGIRSIMTPSDRGGDLRQRQRYHVAPPAGTGADESPPGRRRPRTLRPRHLTRLRAAPAGPITEARRDTRELDPSVRTDGLPLISSAFRDPAEHSATMMSSGFGRVTASSYRGPAAGHLDDLECRPRPRSPAPDLRAHDTAVILRAWIVNR